MPATHNQFINNIQKKNSVPDIYISNINVEKLFGSSKMEKAYGHYLYFCMKNERNAFYTI